MSETPVRLGPPPCPLVGGGARIAGAGPRPAGKPPPMTMPRRGGVGRPSPGHRSPAPLESTANEARA